MCAESALFEPLAVDAVRRQRSINRVLLGSRTLMPPILVGLWRSSYFAAYPRR